MNEPNLKRKEMITDKAIIKQKRILIVAILCVITLFISSSYALLTNFDKTDNVVNFTTGNLNMSVNNTAGVINLNGNLPENDENGLTNATPITLTLTNTGTMFIDGYEVKLVSDENKTSTLNEDYIKYAISEDGTTYTSPSILTTNDNIIFSGYDLEIDASKTIYLKVWIDESAGNNALNKEYYGSIEVELYQKKEIPTPSAAETIIGNVETYAVASASDFEGGLVGINTSGTLYNETTTEEVREYRYSGPSVDNYAYFNCNDTDGTYNYGDDNYDYLNNCETWRIVGTFKNANDEWNLKLMRNTVLTSDELPETYVIDGTTYRIENGTTGYAYWNYPDTTNHNDWTSGGLQYFLNTESDTNETAGYYGALSSKTKELIDEEYTYYLGNVVYGSSGDTTETAYVSERNAEQIWEGNQASWNGAVGLLYPSDYGYSALSSYWSGTTLYDYDGEAYETSWMQQTANHTDYEWLLSPSSFATYFALSWYTEGRVHNGFIRNSYGVRPVLNLKSSVKVKSGDGTSNLPYVIVGE